MRQRTSIDLYTAIFRLTLYYCLDVSVSEAKARSIDGLKQNTKLYAEERNPTHFDTAILLAQSFNTMRFGQQAHFDEEAMVEEVSLYQEGGDVDVLTTTMGSQDEDHSGKDTKIIEEEVFQVEVMEVCSIVTPTAYLLPMWLNRPFGLQMPQPTYLSIA